MSNPFSSEISPALGAPGLVMEQQNTPAIMQLSAVIEAYKAAALAFDNVPDSSPEPESSTEWASYVAAERSVIGFPCQSMQVVRAKALYLLEDEGLFSSLSEDFEEDGTPLLKRFLRSLTGETPEPADPLIAAIQELRDGMAAYEAMPDFSDDPEGEEAAIAATYGPADKRIAEWDQPAISRAGAMAALRLAREEGSDYYVSVLVPPMVAAALAYFERETSE